MKKDQKTVKTREPITKEALFRRNPVPFGDVRKYYYAACIGTVILLTLCFHISVVAIALRTDSCEQLSNVFIVFLLLFCITTIVGHQMRSFLGYGISAISSLIVLLLLQFYHGTGVMIISNLPEYGEVFRDGAKSTDFWILLAKAIAVVHLLLTFVFINSTIKVKEEPALKGMNVQIQKIKVWLDKNNNSLPAGRRASDYWFTAVSILLYMVFIALDPGMSTYDYYSLLLFSIGGGLIACKNVFSGAFLLTSSAVIRCTLYQWRFGLEASVVIAYASLWIALTYLLVETVFVRKVEHRSINNLVRVTQNCLCWCGIMCFIALLSIHEVLVAFSGSYMVFQKDNLPVFFFVPVLLFLGLYSEKWYGYLLSSLCCYWLWEGLNHSTPLRKGQLFYFDSIKEHGSVGIETTERMMSMVHVVSGTLLVFAVVLILESVLCFLFNVTQKRGKKCYVTKE